MDPVLRITLLGDFRITWEDRDLIALHARRRCELLALLVFRRGAPRDRSHLAFLLWPDSTEAQARTNLRQLLHRLRRELPNADRFLALEGPTVRWREDAPAVVDVHELEAAWDDAEQAGSREDREAEVDALTRAAGLYRGDLVPGSYHPWIEEERQHLRRRAVAGIGRLVELLEEERRYAEALDWAGRLRELDPLRERTYQVLIRLHALRGDPARGVALFRDLVRLLDEELGVEPDDETVALVARIRGAGSLAPEGPSDSPGSGHSLPMVGRRREWRALLETWERVLEEGTVLALLTGEPGIGKTRLAEELLAWAERQGFATAKARAYPGEGSLPYDPVSQWLGAQPFLGSALALDPPWRAELARVVPEMAASPEPEPPRAASDGEWRRRRLFEAMARAVRGSGGPAVLVLDDLQWSGRETLEWLAYLLRFDPAAPMLVLATVRPGEVPTADALPQWRESLREAGRLVEIPVEPLEPEETSRLAEGVLARRLDAEQGRVLHERTEGNPLFIVETLRAGPRADVGPELPERIQGVIRYRLEQLTPEARELLGIGAVLGRRFDLEVLRDAANYRFEDETFVGALDEIVARHLLREGPEPTYEFSHDRIREVTGGELGQARRRFFHRRAAEALERAALRNPQMAGRAVARHFEKAGLPERAVVHYRRAADQALAVYAHEEAVEHLERALLLLEREPDSPARKRRELELQLARGVPLVAIHHYSGRPVWEAYNRARELAEALGEAPGPPTLRALALHNLMHSRNEEVMDLGRRLLHRAEERGDPMLRVEAHYVLGVGLYWQGRIPASRRHLETSLEHYDPSRAQGHIRLYAQDPAIICRIRLALARWHLGEPSRALKMVREALADAHSLGHPFTLAYARYFGSWVLIEAGAMKEARRAVRALVSDASERSLSVWPELAVLFDGWLRVMDSGSPEGFDRMQEVSVRYREAGLSLGFPYHAVLFARACRRLGTLEEGLYHLDQGLSMSRETGERFWDAELERMRAELLRETGGSEEESLRALESAREIARRQRALSLELRVALTLARWRRDEGTANPEVGPDLERLLSEFPSTEESLALSEARSFLAKEGVAASGRQDERNG